MKPGQEYYDYRAARRLELAEMYVAAMNKAIEEKRLTPGTCKLIKYQISKQEGESVSTIERGIHERTELERRRINDRRHGGRMVEGRRHETRREPK